MLGRQVRAHHVEKAPFRWSRTVRNLVAVAPDIKPTANLFLPVAERKAFPVLYASDVIITTGGSAKSTGNLLSKKLSTAGRLPNRESAFALKGSSLCTSALYERLTLTPVFSLINFAFLASAFARSSLEPFLFSFVHVRHV